MPALTREGLRGLGPVRARTAGTVALLAVPAAIGLALLAPGVLVLLFGADYAVGAPALRWLCLGLVPVFMNAVLLHSLIAAGRADLPPRLSGIRVAVAAALALALIPSFGAAGAALGFAASELVLLGLGVRACHAIRFPVPVVKPVLLALGASLPMAAAVGLAGRGPLASLALGLATYALTLAAAWRLTPRFRQALAHDVHGS
jgi:O-antigen/teichoic acid export membrane protein